jgi:hypothetical protein
MSAWHGIISAKFCPISAGRIELRAESQEDMPHAKGGKDEKVKKKFRICPSFPPFPTFA